MRTFALILFECAERANSSAAYTRCHAVGYPLVGFSITILSCGARQVILHPTLPMLFSISGRMSAIGQMLKALWQLLRDVPGGSEHEGSEFCFFHRSLSIRGPNSEVHKWRRILNLYAPLYGPYLFHRRIFLVLRPTSDD